MPISVLVVVPKAFNRFELWPVLKALKREKFEFVVASTDAVIEEERDGRSNFQVERYRATPLDQVSGDFQGLIVLSGNRYCREKLYWDTSMKDIVLGLQDNVLATSCAMTPAIRWVLKGRRVTVYPLPTLIDLLEKFGAIVVDDLIVVDQNIVTTSSETAIFDLIDEFVKLIRR